MKIRKFIATVNRVYNVEVRVEDLSALEQEMVKKFGAPEISAGGEFSGSATRPGEAEAIALAQAIPNSTVLLDDAQARRVAERLAIRRIGTLGILRRAKKAGLILALKPYIQTMQNNGIYIRFSLVEAVLRDVGEVN